jgi:hypothetical protein
MPFNLIKQYNSLLDIIGMDERSRIKSLLGIFNRDITTNIGFSFRGKPIYPTPKDNGEDAMASLFNHLTRKMNDGEECHREFDCDRSIRLHWIRYHIEERKNTGILCFSVKEPTGYRTYIYDVVERYAIVLEPLRNNTAYYLLTAYPLKGKDSKRDKIMNKYNKRKLPHIL